MEKKLLCLLMLILFTVTGRAQVTTLTPPEGASTGLFGQTIAIAGNYAVIGAMHDDDLAKYAGAIYIYEKDSTGWRLTEKLKASDGQTGDYFGNAVAIDGATILVGAYWADIPNSQCGAAYIFEKKAGGWIQTTKIVPDDVEMNDNFGNAVAISGNWMMIGAYSFDDDIANEGAVYFYHRENRIWRYHSKKCVPEIGRDAFFGCCVDIDGKRAIVGAFGHEKKGSAYIFELKSDSWELVRKVASENSEPYGFYGMSVGISGNQAVVGAYRDSQKAQYAGAVYVYDKRQNWGQSAVITAPDASEADYFGHSVALDDRQLIVGAYGHDSTVLDIGAVYVFEQTNTWKSAYTYLPDTNEMFNFGGIVVGVSGNTVIAGSGENNSTNNHAGEVYIIDLNAL